MLNIILWALIVLLLVLVGVLLCMLHFHILRKYLPHLHRIFQEKPLFVIPFGQPIPDAEEVVVPTTNNLRLHGCYLKTPAPRKGVIFFGLEYGSNCWSCQVYCEFLLANGYDIFALETRGQGTSPTQESYDPLQWVTTFEIEDYRAALAYLKQRPDADPRGVGLFGLSKGGSTGLFVAAEDPFIRCCAVDGIFSTYTTMLPYMIKWVWIYTNHVRIVNCIPYWYFRYAAGRCQRIVGAERKCSYPSLEKVLRRVAPRPLLMVHGGADTYIKPDMAKTLFDLARAPKEFWLVDGAKHNQSVHVAGQQYKQRILDFFDRHLAQKKIEATPSTNGVAARPCVTV